MGQQILRPAADLEAPLLLKSNGHPVAQQGIDAVPAASFPWQYLWVSVCLATFAFGLATFVTHDPTLPSPYAFYSSWLGWSYFACWSLSFYPQIIKNYLRKSVDGLSYDFQVYNLLGFGCYSLFNCALFFSKSMQIAYSEAHGGASIPVQVNDVFFSLHALAATVVMCGQCILYDQGGQRVSEVCKLFTAAAVLGSLSYGLVILIGNHYCSCWDLLSFLSVLSSVKLIVTIFKYTPQIKLHYVTKSTAGWSVENTLLDLAGGMLSLAQLLGDAYATNTWSAITGNLVKFGLGFVSIFADVTIMVQHYILYPSPQPVSLKVSPSHLSYHEDIHNPLTVVLLPAPSGKGEVAVLHHSDVQSTQAASQ